VVREDFIHGWIIDHPDDCLKHFITAEIIGDVANAGSVRLDSIKGTPTSAIRKSPSFLIDRKAQTSEQVRGMPIKVLTVLFGSASISDGRACLLQWFGQS